MSLAELIGWRNSTQARRDDARESSGNPTPRPARHIAPGTPPAPTARSCVGRAMRTSRQIAGRIGGLATAGEAHPCRTQSERQQGRDSTMGAGPGEGERETARSPQRAAHAAIL